MQPQFVKGRYTPGCILSVPVMTEVGVVAHKGILSDQRGIDGHPMVVHNAKIYGHIIESTMTEFCLKGLGPVNSDGYPGKLPPMEVLARARSEITKPWRLWRNCEHFANWSQGLPERSPQVRSGMKKGAFFASLAAVGFFVFTKTTTGI